LNGASELALTKLDVLDEFPSLRICTGYRMPDTGDRLWHYWELDAHRLEACLPIYIDLEGWQQSTQKARQFSALPPLAQAYVHKIEELTGTMVRYISVGPEREATIQV
jgi:adenylosuccinate synthase